MESLGISTDDVFTLFMLIDADHNGLVDLDEFVSGCMQCLGPVGLLFFFQKIPPASWVWGDFSPGRNIQKG